MKHKALRPVDVAPLLGITPQAIRVQMRNGKLPIGVVNKGKKGNYSYTIIPKMLYEVTGIKANGYEPDSFADLDYTKLANAIIESLAKKVIYG